MSDLDQILPLWRALKASGTEYVLATVVQVEGSGYRKPGARMLTAADGRRAGTISGGCLEGEVAKKAMWRTENGPLVRRYSTIAEDGEVPYGMGCGGVIHLLLERSTTALPLMQRLAESFDARTPLAIATVLDGKHTGLRAFWPDPLTETASTPLLELALRGYTREQSFSDTAELEDGLLASVRVEFNPARPGLFVFGAGDDAIPVVRLARQLGWYVAVSDGRSNLATAVRFPDADDVYVLEPDTWPSFKMRSTDAAALLTHSLQQDTRILSHLLPTELNYIGVLGPRRRTDEILESLADEAALSSSAKEALLASWSNRIFGPMGLDLGGDTSADIALAAIAEIQQHRSRATALSLRQLRTSSAQTNKATV